MDVPFRITNWPFLIRDCFLYVRTASFVSTCRGAKDIHVFALHCLRAYYASADLIFVIPSLVLRLGHHVFC